jgi:hypothetical protein
MLSGMNQHVRQGIPLVPQPDLARERAVASFYRACALAAYRVVDPSRGGMENYLQRQGWGDDRLAGLLTRAAAAPAMTSQSGWASQLGRSIVADFLAGLGPVSAGADLFQQALSLSFDGAASVHLPHFVAEFANSGFVAEGQPIPVHALALGDPNVLSPHKLAAIAVLTREMIESSNAEKLVGDVLTRSAGRILDEVLFDANPESAARPAGLRNGIAATAASAATESGAAFTADIGALADKVSPVAGNSGLAFIASPGRALKIKLRLPNDIDGVTVLGSSAVINDLLCVATSALVSIADAAPSIEASKAAVLHRDTAPAPIVNGGQPAAPSMSVFQHDAVALKVRWPVTWSLRDPRGFAWTTPTAW